MKSVKPAQFRWLAQRGATSIVVSGIPRASAQTAREGSFPRESDRHRPEQARCPRSRMHGEDGEPSHVRGRYAPTPVAAVRLARRGLVDYVVIRAQELRGQLRMLRGSTATRSRIVAVLPLSTKAAARAAWRSGIAYAAADPVLELAVGARTRGLEAARDVPRCDPTREDRRHSRTTGSDLVARRGGRRRPLCHCAGPPRRNRSPDMGVYLDGSFVVNVGTRALTLTGLQCGRSYTFGVDAYDDSGALVRPGRGRRDDERLLRRLPRRGRWWWRGVTPDVLPPTAPLGLAVIAATQTSVTVALDRVGRQRGRRRLRAVPERHSGRLVARHLRVVLGTRVRVDLLGRGRRLRRGPATAPGRTTAALFRHHPVRRRLPTRQRRRHQAR